MKPGAAAAAAATVDLKSFQTYCFRLHRSITANASWRAGVSNHSKKFRQSVTRYGVFSRNLFPIFTT